MFEAKNLNQVIDGIHAVGRASQRLSTFSGPYLGVKLSEKNERNFTEEQLRQGETMVPTLSHGNHGASQSGQFDTSRDIVRGAGARESTMAKNQ